MGFSDRMLDSGCARHIEAAHSEAILILSGPDKDKTFYAVKETESDIVIDGELSEDRRAKRVIRFRDSSGVPVIAKSGTKVQTADSKTWIAVRAPQDGYLTTDFELREIVSGKDQ